MDSDKGIINLFVPNGTGKSLYKLIKIIQEKCIEFEKKRHFISGYFPTDRSRTIKSHVDCILSNGFLLAALVEMTREAVAGECSLLEMGSELTSNMLPLHLDERVLTFCVFVVFDTRFESTMANSRDLSCYIPPGVEMLYGRNICKFLGGEIAHCILVYLINS